jgi:hypothetical protein
METKEFLSAVVGNEGYYCVVGIQKFTDGDGKEQTRAIPEFYTSADEAAEAAHKFDVNGFDAYYTPATFKDSSKGRKADNALQVKALFLDLDCGEGKPYATQADALKALREFRKGYDLPKCTAVVNSGRGLHVYWVLTRPYSREEWVPVAEQLKAACYEFGLEADPVVTADAARILRVPNTHNFKGAPPLDVKLVGKELAGYVTLEDFTAKLPASVKPVLIARDYSAEDTQDISRAKGNQNYTKKFSKLLASTAAGKGCGQVHRAIMQPNDLSYTDWLHVLSIAKHCEEDGEQAIHLISSRYDGYSENETTKVANSIETPHLCMTFEKDNPSGCEGCPHKGKIKSPIKLCMEMKEAQSDIVEVVVEQTPQVLAEGEEEEETPPPLVTTSKIPDYPFPYKRSVNGSIYVTIEHEDGTTSEETIYKRPLYITKRLLDPFEGPSFEFKHHTDREGIQTFVIPMAELTSPEAFRKAMGMNDIFVLRKQADALMTYVGAWINRLQSKEFGKDFVNVHVQFGWTEDMSGFVLGDREIKADEIVINPASSRTAQYFPMFKKRGTLEGWKKVTDFYNRPNFEEHQYMFGLGFGAPLMAFIPNIAGAIYHLMSPDSGYGKTTGMYGGASIWGNPKKLVMRGKDTGNSAWNRAEIWKNLPLYIDEITNYEPKAASEFCYAAVDGEQKNRLNNSGQNSERYRGMEWALLIGTNGNTSLQDIVSKHREHAKGEIGRMLEATATKKLFSREDTLRANTLNDDLAANYGHAGEVFIQHILKNMKATEKLVLATRDRLMEAADLDSQHRFWLAETTCVYAGTLIAKKLGLHDWDLDALYKWEVAELVRAKQSMNDMVVDIHDLVAQYLNEHPRGILRVKSTADARSGDPEMDNLILPDAVPITNWIARIEGDVNKMYMPPTSWKKWVMARGLYFPTIEAQMKEEMNMVKTKGRLGKGTKIKTPVQHLWVLEWEEADDEVDGN